MRGLVGIWLGRVWGNKKVLTELELKELLIDGIKTNEFPKLLYKYREFGKFTDDIIINSRFYFAIAKDLDNLKIIGEKMKEIIGTVTNIQEGSFTLKTPNDFRRNN